MTDAIDKITTEDLFMALGNPDFMWKLYTAGKERTDYHKKQLKYSDGEYRHEQYKKMMNHTHLEKILWKCLERF